MKKHKTHEVDPDHAIKIAVDRLMSKDLSASSLFQRPLVNGLRELSWNNDVYVMQQIIGKGKFSTVYKVIHKQSGQSRFAVKVLKGGAGLNTQLPQGARREIEAQQGLSHPNILKLFGYVSCPPSIYLVLELYSVSLYQRLKKNQIEEDKASGYVKQLASALSYLQQLHIAHRDIKPENIMLVDECHVKLCDFGCAICAPFPMQHMRRTLCGTAEYMPPEMFKPIRSRDVQALLYDCRFIDAWALGVLAYELNFGKSPFACSVLESRRENNYGESETNEIVMDNILDWASFQNSFDESEGRFFRNTSQQCTMRMSKLVHGLMRVNPSSRISMQDVMEILE